LKPVSCRRSRTAVEVRCRPGRRSARVGASRPPPARVSGRAPVVGPMFGRAPPRLGCRRPEL